MRKIIYILCFSLLWACQQEEGDQPVKTFQVKYEVLTTSDNWFGEYIIETGEKICTCNQNPISQPGGWTLEFEVKTSTEFELHIDATTVKNFGEVGAPDVTTNIYVDGIKLVTNTSNWAPGVASADYTLK